MSYLLPFNTMSNTMTSLALLQTPSSVAWNEKSFIVGDVVPQFLFLLFVSVVWHGLEETAIAAPIHTLSSR
jgi:hypothetical protein